MRPTATTQGTLQAPLNRFLGTEANVRILRVLAGTRVPLGKAEIARRAELNASGVRRSVDELIEAGIVEPVGAGTRRPVRLRRAHPLAPALESLFEAEHRRFDRLMEGVRGRADRLRPPPTSTWIQGPVARRNDEPGDPLVVGILAPASQVDELRERLARDLDDLARAHDVLLEVRGYTLADLEADPGAKAELEDAMPLYGPSPLSLLEPEARLRPGEAPGDHAALDRRALALGRALAERIAEDPSLLERARRHVRKRLENASPRERHDLDEWARLLDGASETRIRQLLVDPGERATRLRQTLPFLDALSPEERREIVGDSEP